MDSPDPDPFLVAAMSFQNLISGAECAAPANPLSQVLKHTEGDRSLQQDRLAGPSSSRLHHLAGNAPPGASEQDLALAQQFFSGGVGPLMTTQFPMDRPLFMGPPPPIVAGQVMQSWAMEQVQRPPMEGKLDQTVWSREFQQVGTVHSPPPQSAAQQPLSVISNHNYTTGRMSYMNGFRGPMMGAYSGTYFSPPMIAQDKGKEKAKDVDFEAAFAQFADTPPTTAPQGAARIEEVDTSVAEITESMEQTSLGADFASTWAELQRSELPPPKEDLAKWEAEYNQLMASQREDLGFDYGSSMQQSWEQGSKLKFDPDGLPMFEAYTFEKTNKYLESPFPSSLLDSAKALLENNGSLSEAALMLEAAIQRGELGEGSYEAWILLGETRNMDEREELGMRALMEGVKKAEAAGTPGPGMLSLAISYTNESYDRASYTMLLRWLRAQYPSQHIPEDTWTSVRRNSTWDAHDRITEVFLDLARTQHTEGVMEPDVQIALGVLFYNNNDFDRAKDCFEAALSARPKDYLLWNRLGSSLSNGNKPEEALNAYREALSLRHTYTRAIYNVGVACLNIGAHREAAEHFLSALDMQESSSGDTSDQVWITLRRTFLAMDRSDLAEMAKPEVKSSLDFFRREGFDF